MTAGTPGPGESFHGRRGHFWVAGDVEEHAGSHIQRGPMFVQWESPERPDRAPVVLVHGGGGQGTDWTQTPDGRPGWASRLRELGHPVYVVDRPGHGRSPAHPEALGPVGPPPTYEFLSGLFAGAAAEEQTNWPWGRTPGTPELDQLVASSGPLPADLARAQALDGTRIGRLLDLVGPAIVIAHSAGVAAALVAVDRTPDQVLAMIAVEPVGPPFVNIPEVGELTWGVTAAQITVQPATPPASLADKRGTWRYPNLARNPILVVSADASPVAAAAAPISGFLRDAGCEVEHLELADHGITGNGHGLIFELNSDETLAPITCWIDDRISRRTERNSRK